MTQRLNILVPTDFSAKSINALHYALALAQYYPADIHLLHAYHLPITIGVSTYPMEENLLDTLEQEAQGRLKTLAEAQGLSLSQLHTRLGFAVDEIERFAKSQAIDLIVMGARGGGAQEAIWGSTATTLMQRSALPLVLVPENAVFKGFFNIAFACDGGAMPSNTLSYLRFFAEKSHAIIHCVSVQERISATESEKLEVVKQIEHAFPEHMHHFCISRHTQLEEALQDFVHQYNIDLLVMTPRRHDFWTQLFKGSHTKKMAFKTDTPLFVLKEQDEQ